jgi:putative oxidoreductase
MTALINLYLRLAHAVEYRLAPVVMPTLARFLFAAILGVYYWTSGMTKVGEDVAGLFSPSFNAFAQMFPKAAEAVSYDVTQATPFQQAVVLAGTWAEFLLPAAIVIGLFTRFAAVGMIAFVVVQSLTDLLGHGALSDPKVLGAWFDVAPDGVILDQRALWILLLLVLVFRGAGPISADRLLMRRFNIY